MRLPDNHATAFPCWMNPPDPMRIGDYTLANRLILAPMAGISDKPFRTLCRRHGAALAFSEMISSNAALRGTRKTVLRLDHSGEPGPVVVQILGTDPAAMAEAARINIGYGADIIDINMGCPAKKVCKADAGSALLRDEIRVGQILRSVVEAVPAPVTLKIRTGWDKTSRNALGIAHIAEDNGIQALTIHGRTRACGFAGDADYETIRKVKESISIPVIANGDIDAPEKARQVLDFTGADALMIGRAARGRPWLFDEIDYFLATGQRKSRPQMTWIKQLLLEHLSLMYHFYGEVTGVRVARKHIAWYSKGLGGNAGLRRQINGSTSPQEQLDLIERFFEPSPTHGLAA